MEIAESSAFCLSSYSKLVTCLYWSALLRTLYLRSEYRGSRCKHWIPLTTANRSRLICTEEYGQAAYLGAEPNLPPSQCHRAPFTQTLCRAVLPCPTLPYLPQQWSVSQWALAPATAKSLWLCLDALKSALCKIRFPVTSNLRYIYGVLNVDKIKN
jgi:hypothetical protein